MLNGLLGIGLRETELSADRLAMGLRLVGEARVQAELDRALVGEWLRVYGLPTERVRLASRRVSVSRPAEDEDGLSPHGHSTDHRPERAQLKGLLWTLDRLGLPLSGEVLGGQSADDGLSGPAYERMAQRLGGRDVLGVADSQMAA
jgi:hypothetical protein